MKDYHLKIFMGDDVDKAQKKLDKAKADKRKALQDEINALEKKNEYVQGDKQKREQELKDLG